MVVSYQTENQLGILSAGIDLSWNLIAVSGIFIIPQSCFLTRNKRSLERQTVDRLDEKEELTNYMGSTFALD